MGFLLYIFLKTTTKILIVAIGIFCKLIAVDVNYMIMYSTRQKFVPNRKISTPNKFGMDSAI